MRSAMIGLSASATKPFSRNCATVTPVPSSWYSQMSSMVSKSKYSPTPMRRASSRKIHHSGRLSKRGAMAWSRMLIAGLRPLLTLRMLARSR